MSITKFLPSKPVAPSETLAAMLKSATPAQREKAVQMAASLLNKR
ncbi:MAG: hypothetical protein RI907_3812, partial [Pseudomonadota bacterium]